MEVEQNHKFPYSLFFDLSHGMAGLLHGFGKLLSKDCLEVKQNINECIRNQ